MNPLDQLADINTPAQVSVWPLAWGYWVLIIVLLALCVYLCAALYKYYQRGHAKRAALQQLRQLDVNDANCSLHAQVFLKKLFAHYFSRQSNLHLHGKEWQKLVIKTYSGNKKAALTNALVQIEKNLYAQTNEDENREEKNKQIVDAISDWIISSLPPSKQQNNGSEQTTPLSTSESSHV